jgi:AraC-like DNA-binding protein
MEDIRLADSLGNKSWTGTKMEWLQCAAYDVKPVDFKVAFVVIQYVNENTGECYPSVETIALKCGLSERHVQRALKRLCASGWLKRRRTRDANRYTPLANNINRCLDDMLLANEARRERTSKRKRAAHESVSVSQSLILSS